VIALLIQVLIVLIVFGIVLWLVQTYLPLPAGIKNLVYIVIVLLLILYLLRMLGIIRA
jgi:hypothetical protein